MREKRQNKNMKGDGRKNRERPLERKNKKHGKKETREI